MQLLDTDKDGIITRSEIQLAVQEYLKGNVSGVQIADILDASKDNIVDVAALSHIVCISHISGYVRFWMSVSDILGIKQAEDKDVIAEDREKKKEADKHNLKTITAAADVKDYSLKKL